MLGVYEVNYVSSGSFFSKAQSVLVGQTTAGNLVEVINCRITVLSSTLNAQYLFHTCPISSMGVVGTATLGTPTENSANYAHQYDSLTAWTGAITAEPATYIANANQFPMAVPTQGGYYLNLLPEERRKFGNVTGRVGWGIYLDTAPSPAIDIAVSLTYVLHSS